MERLQKIIAECGICSRRKAEELIRQGKVCVNGEVINELGYKADKNANITVDGKAISFQEKLVFLLNKPKNVISAVSDKQGRTTVVDLIDTDQRIFPMGRLDYDSTGLLLLSNDGELMQKLIHPKFGIDKIYEVNIDGIIKQSDIDKLQQGIAIEDYISAPAVVELIRVNNNKNTSFLKITIHEGKNREIRKMFEALGYKVNKLHRIKIANIELGNLKMGEYRQLKPYEIKKLKKYLDSFNN